ncbi:phosphatidylinositol-specific phospholipase C domain-containing protein (plasmid) [Bacillus mycoides]|uniref:phosphatidylinositol-specific phospholipase C domain-containing protein n=1 Tax=Bacillus mycoides TaxID=1405 RepID=UPI001C011115|nr:phosphatidylinositol-specific phospholipase C domain-containing protein [Bacillus mycoides]QWH76068.1 phosphatidylinositol-specific phospholipase C domain-containing protein [Bacillus mycoides]QWI47080.1 phosphatidylinositol-specific phospholipase C domain-containing protein [Bacillus mycoides]
MENNNTSVSLNNPENTYEPIITFDLNGTSDRSGVSFNNNVGIHNPRWMSGLNNSSRISELSIPGTHGSMALYGAPTVYGRAITINQTMNLTTQLNSGIRYIDIRCRHVDNRFAMHHGRVFQNAWFDTGVLNPIRTFLSNNPSETILMRVQQEYTPQNNTRSFEATFANYHSRYQSLFWNPTGSNNPTLGETRGRIILLQQFDGPMFGIRYANLNIQDQWRIEVPPLSPNATYSKWIAVRNQFNNAMNNRNIIHLNHLSANPGGIGSRHFPWWPYPWFIASGYTTQVDSSPSQVAETSDNGQWPDYIRESRWPNNRILFGGTNNLTTRRIRDRRINHTGIIAADFPGRGLIQYTIDLNNRLTNTPRNGNFQIVTALNNSSVLDLNGSNNVTLWSNNGGNHQRWNFTYEQSRNAYVIRNVSNQNLVLTWDILSQNRNVVAAQFNPFFNQQYWILEPFQNGYVFRNLHNPNLVLDVYRAGTANGTNITVYGRNPVGSAHRNQTFFLRRV